MVILERQGSRQYRIWIMYQDTFCVQLVMRGTERILVSDFPDKGVVLIYRERYDASAYFIEHSRRIPAVAFMIDGITPLKVKWMYHSRSYNEYLTLAKERM